MSVFLHKEKKLINQCWCLVLSKSIQLTKICWASLWECFAVQQHNSWYNLNQIVHWDGFRSGIISLWSQQDSTPGSCMLLTVKVPFPALKPERRFQRQYHFLWSSPFLFFCTVPPLTFFFHCLLSFNSFAISSPTSIKINNPQRTKCPVILSR